MPVEKFGGSDAITFVATVTVKPEHERDYVALVTEVIDTVASEEPSTMLYVLCRHPSLPHTYVARERYRDADALQAHAEAPYLARAIAKLQDWVAEPVESLGLTQIAPA
jgi:quinol monooxygenase YgiN